MSGMSADELGGQTADTLLQLAELRNLTFDFAGAEAALDALPAEQRNGSEQVSALRAAIARNASSHLYQVEAPRIRAFADRAPGGFDTRAGGVLQLVADKEGLTISGHASDGAERLYLFVEDHLVGIFAARPPSRPHFPPVAPFSGAISRRTLRLFPEDRSVKLAVSTGPRLLLDVAGAPVVKHRAPKGRGGLHKILAAGGLLTSHAQITPPKSTRQIAGWMHSYGALRAHLAEAAGSALMLCYGSLLGAIREGRVIPHDDDLDTVVLLRARSHADAAAEFRALTALILSRSDTVDIETWRGRFLKVSIGEGSKIDVFPAWHDGQRLWCPLTTCLDCDPDLLVEAEERDFHGTQALVPRRAEEFLALKYGPGWRIPDPGYRAASRKDVTYPFASFAISEDELPAIRQRAAELSGRGATGKLSYVR